MQKVIIYSVLCIAVLFSSLTFAQEDSVTYLESEQRLVYEINYNRFTTLSESLGCSASAFENGLMHSAIRHLLLFLPYEASFYDDVENLEVVILQTRADGSERAVLRLEVPLERARVGNARFRVFMNGFASARAGFCFAVPEGTLNVWFSILVTQGADIAYDPELFSLEIAQASDITTQVARVPANQPANQTDVEIITTPTPAASPSVGAGNNTVNDTVVDTTIVPSTTAVTTGQAPANANTDTPPSIPNPVTTAPQTNVTQPSVTTQPSGSISNRVAGAATVNEAVVAEGYRPTPYISDTPFRDFFGAEDVLLPSTDYAAIIETTKGNIVVDLFEDDAPNTVNNFVYLSRYRFYEDIYFHRVLENFMAQTGDPAGTGAGGPGYQFDDEFSARLSHDKKGMVAMANNGPDTNGSQFFITLAPTTWLDGVHSIFGEVTAGLDVLDSLQRIDPQELGEPLALSFLDDSLGLLAAQGVELSGDPNLTLREYFFELYGTVPQPGFAFSIDGFDSLVGAARDDDELLVGFWNQPDQILSVQILERPK